MRKINEIYKKTKERIEEKNLTQEKLRKIWDQQLEVGYTVRIKKVCLGRNKIQDQWTEDILEVVSRMGKCCISSKIGKQDESS